MKKKILVITGVIMFTFALVANLQYAFSDYGVGSNSIGAFVLAQTGGSGGTGGTGGTGGGSGGNSGGSGGNSGGGSGGAECNMCKLTQTIPIIDYTYTTFSCKPQTGGSCTTIMPGMQSLSCTNAQECPR
jgi:hypothetical protein